MYCVCQITDNIFEVNLRFDTNFSTIVIDRDLRENGKVPVLPFHDFALNEGIEL